jgi:hypothetical protein
MEKRICVHHDWFSYHLQGCLEALCLKQTGRKTMDMGPDFRERRRGAWRVTDRIKHNDPNLAARESEVCSILAELQAKSIREHHREVSLAEPFHLPVPLRAHKLLETILNGLHASSWIIYQDVSEVLGLNPGEGSNVVHGIKALPINGNPIPF